MACWPCSTWLPPVPRFGKPCNWTLGGLFALHKLEVVTPDGEKHPRFELATPAEAQAHMAARVQQAA